MVRIHDTTDEEIRAVADAAEGRVCCARNARPIQERRDVLELCPLKLDDRVRIPCLDRVVGHATTLHVSPGPDHHPKAGDSEHLHALRAWVERRHTAIHPIDIIDVFANVPGEDHPHALVDGGRKGSRADMFSGGCPPL